MTDPSSAESVPTPYDPTDPDEAEFLGIPFPPETAESDRGRKKPLLCRLGFHQIFADTSGMNCGTTEKPIILMVTTTRCNRCEWSS